MPLKLFRATVANANTEILKVSSYIIRYEFGLHAGEI